MKLLISSFLLALSFVPVYPYAGGTAIAAPARGQTAQDTPFHVLYVLQQSWMSGASDRIARLFQPEDAFLALGEDGPPAGRYSSSQIRYLIGDLLKFTTTISFEYVKYERKKRDEGRASAAVTWEYTRDSDDQAKERELELILVESGGRWVIQSLAATD